MDEIVKIRRCDMGILLSALCYERTIVGDWNFVYGNNTHWRCATSIFTRIYTNIVPLKMDKIVKILHCEAILWCALCYTRKIEGYWKCIQEKNINSINCNWPLTNLPIYYTGILMTEALVYNCQIEIYST